MNQTHTYQNIYDNLYSIGYHSDPGYSHSRPLIDYLVSHYEFKTIIDVGASTGAAIRYLTRQYDKIAMGVEVSLVAVNQAHRYNTPVFRGCATRLPFADKSTDVVLSTETLEHLKLPDVQPAIEEMKRVSSKYIAIQVGLQPEQAGWGKRVGVPDLHFTIKPIEWWKELFCYDGWKEIYSEGASFIVEYKPE